MAHVGREALAGERVAESRIGSVWVDRAFSSPDSSPAVWERVHENTIRNLLKGLRAAKKR